jgi:hypothetical protein
MTGKYMGWQGTPIFKLWVTEVHQRMFRSIPVFTPPQETSVHIHRLIPCLTAFFMAGGVVAQEIPGNGVAVGQSEQASSKAISAACGQITRIEVVNTRFPAASRSEVHLRCKALALADGRPGGDAMFTFADDKLVLFEARGASANLRPEGDPAAKVAGFEVFLPQQLVIDEPKDRAVVFGAFALAPLALHWNNPAWSSDHVAAPTGDFFLPHEVVFGATRETMTTVLDRSCAVVRGKAIDEVWLATKPSSQFQIDCYGYEMAGYPRKFEFVFGDGVLQQMWLLFDEGDIPRLRAFLTGKFGPSIQVDENYEIFDNWRVALRKDVPELRIASDTIARIWSKNGGKD